MKNIYTLLFACIAFMSAHATSHTITISGFFYAPSTLTVSVGDVITIQANTSHPAVEVDLPIWNANGTTPLSGGWGVKTADYTFTVSTSNTIYYVCQAHVGTGMKGQITVIATGIKENSKMINEFSVFPNPVSETLSLNYTLNEKSSVQIDLISINGQHAATLVNEVQMAGVQQKTFNISPKIAPGNYFLRISANGNKPEDRLIIIK